MPFGYISRRTTMALRLEPAYGPKEGLLRSFATDEALLVRCAVSKAGLTALKDDALGGLDTMIVPSELSWSQEIGQGVKVYSAG
jgi:hypothetical protein